MSLNKLRKLLESIIDEDWLSLEDRLVEIGVLSYLSQRGKLNHSREDKLRTHMLEAVSEIKDVVKQWFTSHALYPQLNKLGGDYSEIEYYYNEMNSETVTAIESYLMEPIDYSDGSLYDSEKLAKIISTHLGGEGYFGRGACSKQALEAFVSEHLETEEDEEDGETITRYYFNGDEDDIINFLIECKNNQVNSDSHFIDLADEMVSLIKDLEAKIDILDIGDLILKFDRLKDLNHANGNLLSDYGDVDWDEVNKRIEARVQSMKESLDEKKRKKRHKTKKTIIKGYPSYFWNHDDDDDSTDSDGGDGGGE